MSCAAVACRSQWLLPLRSAAGSPVPSPSVPEEVCKLSAVTSWRQQWHSPPAVSPCPSRLHSAQLSLGARWAPGPAPCTRRRKPACPCAQDPHSLRRRQKRAPCTNQNAVTSLSRNDGQSGGGVAQRGSWLWAVGSSTEEALWGQGLEGSAQALWTLVGVGPGCQPGFPGHVWGGWCSGSP